MWNKVKDYAGYWVSDDGLIMGPRGKVGRGVPNKAGYYRVKLYRNGHKKSVYVHQLVAQAFILNPDGKPGVNHIDLDKSNNKASNLEWATPLQNSQHARALKAWAPRCTAL